MGVTSRAQRKEELCLKHPAVGVTFLGSVTRAFALPDIHWCMKFLCHPEGMKLREEQGVPLSWLCPLTAGRVSGGSWRSLWILSGSVLEMSEERLG